MPCLFWLKSYLVIYINSNIVNIVNEMMNSKFYKKIKSKLKLKLTLKLIGFTIGIIGLIFIFIILYQYRKRIFVEDFIEHLNNGPTQSSDVDITSEPSEEDKPEQPDTPLELTSNNTKSISDYVVRTVTNAISTVRPDTQGPPGVIGPKGEKGEDGGTFLNKGFLRSINEPNLFLDRDTNKLVVNNKNYQPNQLWTYTSDGKMVNNFSTTNVKECLSVNDEGELQIEDCPIAKKWNYIEKTTQLQTFIDGKSKCLEIKKDSDGKQNILLDNCTNGISLPQSWTFH